MFITYEKEYVLALTIHDTKMYNIKCNVYVKYSTLPLSCLRSWLLQQYGTVYLDIHPLGLDFQLG